jgi:hypothetical protein
VKVGRYILVGLVLVTGVYGARRWRASAADPADAANPAHETARKTTPTNDSMAQVHAPPGVRITVEILNATTVTGLARRATFYLRDHGFDVVATGNDQVKRTETLVLDRTHHPAWATLVAQAMGGTMLSRPDTSRYVDVTVLLGSDWTPPALPFHP